MPKAYAGLDTAADRFHLYCTNGFQASLVLPAKLSPDERRQRLYVRAKTAFKTLPPKTLLVAEEPLALQNGKTTRLLALAAGAIWAAHLECRNLWWAWADVAAWKKAVIGNGNADKLQIQTWVTTNLGLSFDEPDFYDAVALAQYGRLRVDALGARAG